MIRACRNAHNDRKRNSAHVSYRTVTTPKVIAESFLRTMAGKRSTANQEALNENQ